MRFDAVVVGGGPAGLQAAMMLGRARRRVLVCDAGQPRNAPAAQAHGVFTRDGTPPLELLRLARADLAAYPGVSFRDEAVVDAVAALGGFEVTLAGGDRLATRGIVVASGMRDLVRETPGFRRFWGSSVFFCPYCHGWELRGLPLAVYGQDAYATHMVFLLKAWSDDVSLVTDGPLTLDAALVDKLARNKIRVHEGRIVGLEGGEHLERIRFADGSAIDCRGLLDKPPSVPASDLPARLGAEHGPDGLPIIDMMFQSTVPGLFIGGDLTQRAPTVLNAAASGTMAGAGLNFVLASADADRA